MRIVCAFDEGPGVGLGHRRRVEGLAHELHVLGFEVALHVLGAEPVAAEVVLVDSYRVRADDRSRVRGELVLAIDDIERDLAVDLVVDPDPGADARVHSSAAAVLAGAPYALIDPGLRVRRTVPIREVVTRILVTTGGSDADGYGARVASGLAAALPTVAVRQVIGPWGRDNDDENIEIVQAPDGLGPELAAADVVVTAGGVTMLEACCLGRPTVAFSIAPGQGRALAGAAHVGAVVAADASSAAAVAARVADDLNLRARLSATARLLVDGQGSARVAAVIAGMALHGVHAR